MVVPFPMADHDDEKPKTDVLRETRNRSRALAAEMFEQEKPPQPKAQKTSPAKNNNIQNSSIGNVLSPAAVRLMEQYYADSREAAVRQSLSALGAQFPLALKASEAAAEQQRLASQYAQFEASQANGLQADSILVNDVMFPNVAALLFTLRAVVAENVFARNIVEALANHLGLNLGPWDGSKRWRDTIDKSWER